MSRSYGFSNLNKTRIPLKDLQSVSSDQLHSVSDLFTIFLFLRILSYGKTMLWYSSAIRLARSGWVTILCSILNLIFSVWFGGESGIMITQS